MTGRRVRGSARAAVFAALATMVAVFAGTARGDGVGLVTTGKSLPPATIAVIDPESGTSSGMGTTDVRVSVGDIILFRFDFFPVPNGQIHGLNGWLTEYIPPNTEVVGIRLLDRQGRTVEPNYPGIATDGCARPCNRFNSVQCSGGTCNLDDGSLSQLYADTGVFYSVDARTRRNPSMQFIQLDNGIMMIPPQRVGDIDGILGTSAPFFAHNAWDYVQVRALGISNPGGNASGNNGTGNTPFNYGSPVAGPLTHYDFEATEVAGRVEFNGVQGPWRRVRYPGALIGTGSAVSGSGPLLRTIADASAMGHDLTPNNPVPAGANALRFAIGEVRVGEPVQVEVALRVLGTPIDNVHNRDVDCGETFGGDTSARSSTGRAEDNMWSLYLGSPACVFLNLQFDLDSDRPLAVTGETIEFTNRTRNLSTNPQNNVWVRQKFDGSRVSLASATPFPDRAPTCMISNCDGDGLDCLLWSLGTMMPSDEVVIRTRFGVGGGGQVTHVMRSDYTSASLGTLSGNPCAGGSVTSPGFRAQEINMIRPIGVVEATLRTTTPLAPAGGTAAMSGTIGVSGTSGVAFDETVVVLPAGFTVANSGGASTPDVMFNGTRIECAANCTTNTPEFNLATTIPAGASRTLTFSVNVPASPSPANGLFDVDLQVWASQTGYGGRYETYFPDLATIAVGQRRSDVPVLDCPIPSSATRIPGSTTEADGTTIRLYFNLVRRASGTSTGGRFDVGGYSGSFGPLYGGLEVRATAQAAGELESELSEPCTVVFVGQCQDGLDNDGDGRIDFPADPGCSSPTDGDETDPECSDGMDNDGDGDVDWPADLECDGPDDETEGGLPACSDGVDNDGDGRTDFPADSDCTSATDRTEVTLRRCNNQVDDDGDGFVDFPNDPGCHSANDDNEGDFAYLPNDVRARLLFVFDTSGSMNWNTCSDTFTGGDGSMSCPGADVTCAMCSTTPGCGNGVADDSRIFQARAGLSDVVAGFGEVEYGLMRFHQRPSAFECPTTNASSSSGGWQGAGASPCGGGFAGGDVLVGFSPENEYDLLEWMDNSTNYPGSTNPPAALDIELRGSGTTPIAGALGDARTYLNGVRAVDPASTCRPYGVILITDGAETCGGSPTTAARQLRTAGYPVNVIGFATPDPTVRANLDAIASNGGTGSAIFADDATALSAAISAIVNAAILTEVCNGGDDDCDTLIDEGFNLYCNVPGGVTTRTLCADPGETVCDGVDDNCDGRIDEGLANACGTCGPLPTEICNGVDDDCDGPIDEGGVCTGCRPAPEICDGMDNDCDMAVDEMLSRACGTDVGECTAGTEICVAGTWGACSGVGPRPEDCNGRDDDCDGVIDGITRPCGGGMGLCTPGTEACVGGRWSGMCVGETRATPEVCNGFDDDCDGPIDEGNPGGGAVCGTDVGECMAGVRRCVMGMLVCDGEIPPMPEVCDGLDNDCDGVVDDGLDLGAPCGSDIGECTPGILICVGGTVVCDGAIDPVAEACNILDDDCDGRVDESLPLGGECGETEGACVPGMLQCVGGFEVCVGEVPSGPEACDCDDNDCDGTVDEGDLCPSGAACIDCSCALPCSDSEFGRCPEGRIPQEDMVTGECFCVAPRCNPDTCATETVSSGGVVECAPDMPGTPTCVCTMNTCTFACDGVVCTAPTVCHPQTGRCVEDNCRGVGCPPGELCDVVALECIPDPCETAGCAADEVCRRGTCEATCAGVDCPAGQTCHGGVCEDDLCADVSCGAGEVCDPADGTCATAMCGGVSCPGGSSCDPLTGTCEVDECTFVRCPAGQRCLDGECDFDGSVTPDGGVVDVDGGGLDVDGGAVGMDAGPEDPEDRVLATGGCQCDVGARRGSSRAPWLLVPLLALVAWRRRRAG